MTRKVHLRLCAIDGIQELSAGTPVATTSQVEDPERGLMGHNDVHTFWHVRIAVPGHRVAPARVPAGAPNLQAHDFCLVVIQYMGIGNLSLEIGRILRDIIGKMSTIQAPVRVPEVVVARDHKNVLVLVLQRAKPPVEVTKLTVGTDLGHISGVDENVRIRQVSGALMEAVRVADVEDSHKRPLGTLHLQAGAIGLLEGLACLVQTALLAGSLLRQGEGKHGEAHEELHGGPSISGVVRLLKPLFS
mmetsp:Transcript_41392/g.74232  ORF Transcript_41392/g.74232 Transcript_41392/m.74232 type:complete len:246 (+) Transcript_41392:504-1241(+)